MRNLLAAGCLLLSALTALAEEPAPPWLRLGPHTAYDGVTDDLVTGGLGADAMLGKRPGYVDPLHPTVAELRRAALFQPGRGGQGFGRLFGPDVDETSGEKIPGEGKVAGEEYLAYADDGEGKQNVAMLLQIPASLSSERHCLVAIPVNGSASLFRDVVDFGFWGLRHGCAVVYTDKGHGNGFAMLEQDSVNILDGRQVPTAEAGRDAHFRPDLDDDARAKFLAEWPHRIAFKAAHSKQNPEKDWGEDLLKAIRFAFYQLGQRDPGFTRNTTLVIATGSSNGGGAVLYAAERDARPARISSTPSLRVNRKFSSSPTTASWWRADRSSGAVAGARCSTTSRSATSINPARRSQQRPSRRTEASPTAERGLGHSRPTSDQAEQT